MNGKLSQYVSASNAYRKVLSAKKPATVTSPYKKQDK